MRQLTVRFDEELEREIRRVADEYGTSLNQAVIRILRRGAGLSGSDSRGIDDALDEHFGTWSDEEADEFNEAVAVFDAVDEDFWR